MIEFGLKHKHSSGWHKKFPRQKIERESPMHLGMHAHLKFRSEWFEGREGYLSWKDLDKFFERHLGKNVDKVFSEYVKRAKRFDHDVSLRDAFYDALNPKRRYQKQTYCIDSQNRIAKFKENNEKIVTHKEAYAYNESHYPRDVRSYLKENQIVPFGEFYLRERYDNWTKKPIYICSKDWYNTVLAIGTGKQFIRMYNMKRVYIPFGKVNAQGVPKNGFEIIQVPTGRYMYSNTIPDCSWQIYRTEQIPYSQCSNPDFMFFIKGEFDQY